MLEKVPEMLGHALGGVRAGLDHTLYEREAGLLATITVTSPAFAEGAALDARFTEDGAGTSPPLAWTGVPAGTQELVLLVEDADSPTPKPIVHLVAFGLAAADGQIGEGAFSGEMAHAGAGRNTFGKTGWLPPDPPTGHGDHRYCFQLFALDRVSGLDQAAGRTAIAEMVAAHGIARGRLIGTYRRG